MSARSKTKGGSSLRKRFYTSSLIDESNESDITSLKSFNSKIQFSTIFTPANTPLSKHSPNTTGNKLKLKLSRYNKNDSLSKSINFSLIDENIKEDEQYQGYHMNTESSPQQTTQEQNQSVKQPSKSSNSKIEKLFSIILNNDKPFPKESLNQKPSKSRHAIYTTINKPSKQTISTSTLASNKSKKSKASKNSKETADLESTLDKENIDMTISLERYQLNASSIQHTSQSNYLGEENSHTNTNEIAKNYYSNHDKETLDVLMVEFQPWFTSTHGLSRPNSPEKTYQERYYTILNDCIKENMLSEISNETMGNIERRVNNYDLIKNTGEHAVVFRSEINKHYFWSMKKSIIDYILKEENEQKRLGVVMKPKVSLFLESNKVIT